MALIQNFTQKSKLRLNELLSFGRTLEEKLATTAFVSDETVKTQIESCKKALQDLDDSMMTGGKWLTSPEMAQSDKRRDDAQTSLLALIRIYAVHYDPTKRAYGITLKVLADKFSGMTQVAYEEQTGLVDNLLQEADSDIYKDAIEALPDVKGWKEELQAANEQCKAAAAKLVEERMRRNSVEKATVTRKAFNAAYDALVKRFNSLAEVFGDAKYVDLFAWWNALIDRNRVLISARLGAGVGGKTDSGASARPTTPSEPEPEPEPEPENPDVV
ncbi:MAG: DUF6261 family protein [Parabacteroides sp.]